MKRFLIATDFSANAKHALDYGYSLAKRVQADIIICNAITEPANIPQTGIVNWSTEQCDLLLNDSRRELKLLKNELNEKDQIPGFSPSITYESKVGSVLHTVQILGESKDTALIIIGTHGSTDKGTFLLGNHSRQLIDGVQQPLLLIPPAAPIAPIKKIAFATDFENEDEDLECICQLITFARPLNAAILITNIFDNEQPNTSLFINELCYKADYALISYSRLEDGKPVAKLDWLCEHGQIDMLAMIHRPHNFIDNMFHGSQTQQMADHITIPLLVFPANN